MPKPICAFESRQDLEALNNVFSNSERYGSRSIASLKKELGSSEKIIQSRVLSEDYDSHLRRIEKHAPIGIDIKGLEANDDSAFTPDVKSRLGETFGEALVRYIKQKNLKQKDV